ncbi:MAG: hypothetical protein JSU74_07575 [Candidatus Zixiibacteriota bacterium]|nr:MAG: hypothetical protein JSU74_07575 [candidate division Zixibacteria bacterium]
MTMKSRVLAVAACYLATILISGCATMGPAPAKLSAEVGDRVAEMEGLHLHAIKSFFDSERKRVEDFLEKRWIPLYLRNFLGTSRLMEEIERSKSIGDEDKEALKIALEDYLDDPDEAEKAADEIVAAISGVRNQESEKIRGVLKKYVEDELVDAALYHIVSLVGAPDPGLIILEWAQDAQEQINLQRRDMLQPLDEAERTITSELIAAYADIQKANGVVTARLEAAAKLKESQDRMLETFGVRDEVGKLRSKLADISHAVGQGIAKASGVIDDMDEATTEDKGLLNDAISVLKEELGGLGANRTDEGSEETESSAEPGEDDR